LVWPRGSGSAELGPLPHLDPRVFLAPNCHVFRVLAVIALSYFLGCIVAGYYVARLRDGTDIRRTGSGNAGARNVARSHGWLAAAVTLLLDAAKAAAAVLIGRALMPVEWAVWVAIIAVVAGHVWPVQLGFRGGKGVAPALGGFLTADITAAALTLGVGLIVLAITRRFTLSGLLALALAPLSLVVLDRGWQVVVLATIAVAIVLLAHHPRADARRRAAFAGTVQ
jgi:glycerol-3-phosphate acyltransferase PlsY